jgi:catechol 2,3-dioxygenase-like lactoylglutathione lyase family enzyme
MLDHIVINVRDYESSRRFYETALAPLGGEVVLAFEQWKTCGFGNAGKPELWIAQRGGPSAPVHVALTARDRALVDAFYGAAMGAGGSDNGPPGPRPQYHEHYYGAFALPPDGNNIEAVCHTAV